MTDTTTAADWRVETHRVAQRIRARVLEITLLKDGCYLSQALSSYLL